jgi:hypothetical protein
MAGMFAATRPGVSLTRAWARHLRDLPLAGIFPKMQNG